MTRRFSRLRNAPRLNVAATAFRAWEEARETAIPNVGGGTSRGQSIRIQVTPFGTEDEDGVDAIVKVTDRSRLALQAAVGARAAAPTTGMRVAGYKPAKIITFFGTGNRARETSRITNQPYLKSSGQSYTHPFGALNGTDREYSAYNAIATAVLGAGSNRTVTYTPESFRLN
jgi:hypothetical protein